MRARIPTALATLAPLLWVAGLCIEPALSEDFPKYDSSKYCEAISGSVAAMKEVLFKSCLEQEHAKEIQIRAIFGKLDSQTKSNCDQAARVSYNGTYQGYAGCVVLAIGTQFLAGTLDVVRRPEMTPHSPRAAIPQKGVVEDARSHNRQYQIGTWGIIEKRDDITDRPFVIMGSENSSVEGSFFRLSCEDGKPFLAVMIPRFKFKGEPVSGLLRIDDGEVTKAIFVGTRDSGLLVTGLTQKTYSKLQDSRKVAMSATTQDGTSWTISYQFTRTAEAFKPFMAACPIAAAFDSVPEHFDPNALASPPVSVPAPKHGP